MLYYANLYPNKNRPLAQSLSIYFVYVAHANRVCVRARAC